MLTTPNAAVLTVALTWVMILTAATFKSRMWTVEGMMRATGNRETGPDLAGVAGRSDRAAKNMLENLVLFASLLAAAAIAGTPPPELALGVNVFFFARLVYWFVYLAGIPMLRTGVWFVAVVGLALMGWAIAT